MSHSKKHAQLTGLPAEVQLLILASRLELAAEDARFFDQIIESGPDWTGVIADAKKMGMQGLLLKHINAPERGPFVPANALQALRNAYQKAAFRSLRIQGQIRRLVEQARDRRVPLILLKGSALSLLIYGDMALRPMSDVDVLCRPKDVPVLEDVLHAQGYWARRLLTYSRLHEAVRRKRIHLPPYDHPKGVRVEVHLNLFGKETGCADLMDPVWEMAQEVTVDGFHFRTLSNEHMLLHLCLHLHKHIQAGRIVLYWFCDVFEFVRKTRDQLDWEGFWAMAQRLGIEKAVGGIFKILHAGWGLPFPPSMPMRGDVETPPLSALFDPDSASRAMLLHFLPGKRRLLQEVASKYGVAASIGYALRILLPTGDYIRARYSPATRAAFFRCYVRHVYERLHRTLVSAGLQLLK